MFYHPYFCVLYTNSCSSTLPNRNCIKFVDNTALVSLLEDGEGDYGPVLDLFLDWYNKSNLILNTNKTKEMSIHSFLPQSLRERLLRLLLNTNILALCLTTS